MGQQHRRYQPLTPLTPPTVERFWSLDGPAGAGRHNVLISSLSLAANPGRFVLLTARMDRPIAAIHVVHPWNSNGTIPLCGPCSCCQWPSSRPFAHAGLQMSSALNKLPVFLRRWPESQTRHPPPRSRVLCCLSCPDVGCSN